jgi:hypothetical protein
MNPPNTLPSLYKVMEDIGKAPGWTNVVRPLGTRRKSEKILKKQLRTCRGETGSE